jgi:hypothetical protein
MMVNLLEPMSVADLLMLSGIIFGLLGIVLMAKLSKLGLMQLRKIKMAATVCDSHALNASVDLQPEKRFNQTLRK